jgi:hypothetical protein
MNERLKKIRQENPNFDKMLVDIFADNMPDLLLVMTDGEEYDKHIGTKDVAMLAEPYIYNTKGEHVGFRWSYDDVMNVAKNYINIDDMEFYPCDLYVWANVKYGDLSHIIGDAGSIIKVAIAELTDPDFPFYPASQRAFCWLKKHIELGERE